MLTLVTGGARSGKSATAEALAQRRAEHGVVVVATATAGDADMAARISRHQAERPWDWATIEEPRDLVAALHAVPDTATVVVDCLTLWLSNCLGQSDEEVLAAARTGAHVAAARPGEVIVVTNEVGDGIVPADPATRRYRDLLGRVNAVWSLAADRALLVVAGRVLDLRSVADLA